MKKYIIRLVALALWLVAGQQGQALRQAPALRPFYPLIADLGDRSAVIVVDGFRVLQLNMLADGLSGLRADLGAFSRAKADDLNWDFRKTQLLREILQYKPDLITLQECDHYYDFFLPELMSLGYDGLFAPKPSSACLEVSENSDGCAIFLKKDKFRVVSSETLTYALAKADVVENGGKAEDRQKRAQNQVALVALCELVGNSCSEDNEAGTANSHNNSGTCAAASQIIVCTTHLKATKNIVGERTRYLEVTQLLKSVQRLYSAKYDEAQSTGRPEPLILITGDLNAAPDEKSTGFEALAYSAVKRSELGLRSVLNDDMQFPEEVWTTWKARRKKGKESIAKSCIDYILYRPLSAPLLPGDARGIAGGDSLGGGGGGGVATRYRAGLQAKAVLGLFSEAEIGEDLLPSSKYPSDHLAIAADLEIVWRREK